MPERESHFGAAYAAARERLERELARRPDDPALRLELAQLAYVAGDFDTSERELREVIRLAPAEARAHLRLGDVLAEKERVEEALTEYREAERLAAGSPLAKEAALEAELAQIEVDTVVRPLREAEAAGVGRARTPAELNRLGGLQLLAGRIEDAASSFRKALSLAPGSLQAALNLGFVQGLAAVEPARLKRSVRELASALERFPSEPRLQLHLAELYEASSLYEAAIQRIERALDAAEECLEAYDLAARYALLGAGPEVPLRRKIDEIVARAEAELARSPADRRLKRRLAFVLLGRARYRRAEPEEYRRPCEILEEVADDDEEVAIRIAECRERMGDPDRAERVLRAALERYPRSYRPLFELGGLALRRGRPEEAVDLFRKAVALAPEEAALYQSLRFALTSAKKLRLEEFAARAELAISPSSVDARLRLGLAYIEALKLDEAIGVLKEAAALAPARADVHAALGRAFERSGRADEAESAYRRALELDPAHAETYKGLGTLLLARPGRMREGIEALETYRRLKSSSRSGSGGTGDARP